MIRFVNDLRASASGHLSASLLSLGLLDAASQVATNAVEEARAANQPIALCIALTWAAGLVLLSLGDLVTAERYGEELIDQAFKHALGPFLAAGLCVRGSLAAKLGDPERGLDLLRRGLAEMQKASYLLFYPFFKAELAAALGGMGRVNDGLAEIDEAIRFAEETDYRWFLPELLRAKGEVVLQEERHNQALAEESFRGAIELAHTQGALFWELRAALSTARLRVWQEDRADAALVLQPVFDRFTEGFAVTDLQSAKALLNSLQ
jgi:non-specific serine/threonine protein kinase